MRLIVWFRRRASWPIVIELADYSATTEDTHALVLAIVRSATPLLFDADGTAWWLEAAEVKGLAIVPPGSGS